MNDLILVDRDQWGARYSAGRSKMPAKVREINVHHSVTALTGGGKAYDNTLDPTDDPCRDMRTIERVLHERGLAPGYSFCIHPSGVVLVGAGNMKGAHTAGRNGVSYGVCFMGDYDRHQPTFAQFVAFGLLINRLRFFGALTPRLDDLTIRGHRDHKATACPGANLYPLIRHVKTFARAVA